MASLRPAKCYRRLKRPNTRTSVRKPKRGYVKGVPGSKIHRFVAGDRRRAFPKKSYLIAKQSVMIRHNALEAIRIAINKELEKGLGKDQYFMKILIYPHHVMRENPLATGAGADRFQTGMRKAFGKAIGTAARVKAGQRLVEVRAEKGKDAQVKRALKIAASKLPTKCRIV